MFLSGVLEVNEAQWEYVSGVNVQYMWIPTEVIIITS